MDSSSSCVYFHLAVGARLLSEKYTVIIADFCPVYTLKNGYVHVLAVVKPSAVVGGAFGSGSSGDVGD